MKQPDDIDDVIIRMVGDVISYGFIARQGDDGLGAWLPKPAVSAMEAALLVDDGEDRLKAILDVLDEHADKKVVSKFLRWDATPKKTIR